MTIGNFKEKYHRIVSPILAYAEDHYSDNGYCYPDNASEYLAVKYIEQCASLIDNGVQYLEKDEYYGSELFLCDHCPKHLRRSFERHSYECARHLSLNIEIYLPEYRDVLQLAYLKLIAKAKSIRDIINCGIILLAAATLPEAKTDIRRELRRRGLPYDRTLVSDSTLERRNAPRQLQGALRRRKIAPGKLRSI